MMPYWNTAVLIRDSSTGYRFTCRQKIEEAEYQVDTLSQSASDIRLCDSTRHLRECIGRPNAKTRNGGKRWRIVHGKSIPNVAIVLAKMHATDFVLSGTAYVNDMMHNSSKVRLSCFFTKSDRLKGLMHVE